VFAVEPFEETTLASWQRTIDINLTGAFLCVRRAIGSMRERGFGRIVAVGSSAGKTGGAKSVAAYAASKAGIMTLMKSVANEYAADGILANAVAPALIDTDMVKAMPDMTAAIPLRRLGQPQEVADVVAFLCSAHATFVTGEVVDVNGGFLID
jgi:3-oxoacyl-[acyl-carrier protein] reductase